MSHFPLDHLRAKWSDDPQPVWLWDAAGARILWANGAALSYGGAHDLDDLTRLKFAAHLPFAKQLEDLATHSLGTQGARAQIRFPAGVMDCLCRNMEIAADQPGLLIHLVAQAPLEAGKTTTDGNMTTDSEPEAVQGGERASFEQPQSTPALIEPGVRANGFGGETTPLDEEDLLALQEIARMIKGSPEERPKASRSTAQKAEKENGKGENKSAGRALASDQGPSVVVPASAFETQPSVSLRRKAGVPRESGNGAGNGLPNGKHAGDGAVPFDNASLEASELSFSAEQISHAIRREADGDGERNYFLESLPVALAITMGGRLVRANQAFLYAFGFGSERELFEAGGVERLFPDSRKGILERPTDRPDRRTGGAVSRSVRLMVRTLSRSKRERTLPVAVRNVSTGREPVQILILFEGSKAPDEPDLQAAAPVKPAPHSTGMPAPHSTGMDEGISKNRESRERIDFLAKVNHEVRTPLNSIIGFSELMMDPQFGPVDEDRFRGYARDIHDSALHALSLINDLLDITRIAAGHPDLEFEPRDSAVDLRQVGKLMHPQAVAKKITLDFQPDRAAAVPKIWADERALRQILLNLVSNAIKYTSPGGHVTLSAKGDLERGVTLKVSDSGIGMSREQIDMAMQPFAQLDRSHRRMAEGERGAEKGTGLGLPLTKALADAHFARFSIESRPGKGTAVALQFPPERLVGAG